LVADCSDLTATSATSAAISASREDAFASSRAITDSLTAYASASEAYEHADSLAVNASAESARAVAYDACANADARAYASESRAFAFAEALANASAENADTTIYYLIAAYLYLM